MTEIVHSIDRIRAVPKIVPALPVLCLRGWSQTLVADIFVDGTAPTGLSFEHFNGMSGEPYFPGMIGPGVALFDYDGDGDMDVYLVQGQMLGGKPVPEATIAPRYPVPLTDRPVTMRITWPNGTEERYADLAPGRYHVFRPGGA